MLELVDDNADCVGSEDIFDQTGSHTESI